jgi:alpha-tubulin suppressor-like RCC1 family protein
MSQEALTRRSPTRIWCSLIGCVAVLAAAPASSHAEGGSLAAWGANRHTELGAGYRDSYEETAVPVLGLSNVTALAAGAGFNLALLGNGTVRSWGGNLYGQLGDGTHAGTWRKQLDNVQVSGLSGVQAIAAASSHALALLAGGTVEAWGQNDYGQLGDGSGGTEKATGEPQALPKPVAGLSNVIAVAAGGGSDFALLANHTVMAWGVNHNGQLGIGETGPETCINEIKLEVACSTRPRQVVIPVKNQRGETQLQPLQGVIAISAGAEAAYALLENHHVMAWGANGKGQLGTGGPPLRVNLTPQEVRSSSTGAALSNVVAVSGGAFDALALLEGGQVLGWGAVGKGELGAVAHPQSCKKISCLPTATPVRGLEAVKVSAISAGQGYSLALSAGKVYAFGKNARGQLGNGSSSNDAQPSVVPGLGPVASIAAGTAHALAELQSGVQPPAPLLSLEPAIASLRLQWALHAQEYKVYFNPREAEEEPAECEVSPEEETAEGCEEPEPEPAPKWLESVKLGEQAHSFEFSGLTVQPYLVLIKSVSAHRLEKKRTIVGAPLL